VFPEIGWRGVPGFARITAMKSAAKNLVHDATSSDIATRVDAIDWAQAGGDLDAQGCAVLKGLLSPQ
jgi:uncharacterized protein